MTTTRGFLLAMLASCATVCWCTPAAGQSCNEWTLESTTGPSARSGAGLVYDGARHVAVLFGGFGTDGKEKGDTWEWDGTVWTLRATTGPHPSAWHAMAYDSARGVSVLVDFGETWEWDGSTWKLRSTTGPTPRYWHALAYDSARGVTVMFGGSTGSWYSRETWEWDGNTWALRSTSGPSERYRHALSYDSARGVTVLFGGFDANEWNGEMWEWNGSYWKNRSTDGPSARGNAAMAYDSQHGSTLLFGGINYGAIDRLTWIWDGDRWRSRGLRGPSARGAAAMAYDAARRVAILFGGTKGGGETWEWNGAPAAAWNSYGAGWPGTSGVPHFVAERVPELCTAVALDLGNSLGAATTAFLLLGVAPTDQPTGYDGHLLVVPSLVWRVVVPGGGGVLALPLPCDCALAGTSVYLQALEIDAGASQGISFTPGLQLVLGS